MYVATVYRECTILCLILDHFYTLAIVMPAYTVKFLHIYAGLKPLYIESFLQLVCKTDVTIEKHNRNASLHCKIPLQNAPGGVKRQ